MASDADRIIAALPIENYIGRFVALKRKGNNLWGLCPFHGEKTPSFSVAPQKGIYKCFGCGVGGNEMGVGCQTGGHGALSMRTLAEVCPAWQPLTQNAPPMACQ